MHSFVVFAAVIATAAAGGVAVTGPAGIPTAGGWITGVADTPEVTAAKIQHFAAHAQARGIHAHPIAVAAPVVHAAPVFRSAAIAHPVVHHAAAHSVVHHAAVAHPVVHAGYAAAPVFHHGHIAGIPTAHGVITGVADTPEVSIAKAHHFAAHREALARSG